MDYLLVGGFGKSDELDIPGAVICEVLKWCEVEERVVGGNVRLEANSLHVRSQLASLCKVDEFVDPWDLVHDGRSPQL
jgi:hypothetical protein